MREVATSSGVIDGNNIGGQSTRPTKDRLTKITIWGEYQAIFELTVSLQKKIDENTVAPPIIQITFSVTTPASKMTPYTAEISGIDLPVEKGAEYYLTMFANGTFFWKNVPFDDNCDPTGHSDTSNTSGDMAFMLQGVDNPPSSTQEASTVPTASNSTSTTPTTTNSTGTVSKTAISAPVAAPSILAIPSNFRIDRNLGQEIIFAWDKNTEADLKGYILTIYDGETEIESVTLEGKDLDNYNMILKDHPLLLADKDYNFKLRAQNSAGAISEPTPALTAKFSQEVKTSATEVQSSSFFQKYLYYIIALIALVLAGGIAGFILYKKIATRRQIP